jgi:hypothetical protein
VRAGAAFALAVTAIARRLNAGEIPRSDGFFEESVAGRPAADELLEGVLSAAADAYEERKVVCLGKLYAGLVFDAGVSRAHANHLISLAQRLTYRQLSLMAVIWDGDIAPMAKAATKENPPKQLVFSDELGIEVDEIERLGLVGRGPPGGTPRRSGMTFVDASGVSPTTLTLTAPGKRLYELLELGDVPADARREVLDALWLGAPAAAGASD